MVINIKYTIAFLAFTLFIITGCYKATGGKVYTQRSVKELMDSAEQIMNDNPSQALNLLDSIDSKIIRSRASQARYALLYSETMYKNYIKAPNDSLIMIAVKYYSIKNDILKQFRSFFLLGCIYNESKHYSNAAVALGKAEQLIEMVDDDYRIGLLYTELGNVFFKSYDFHKAEKYFSLAMEHYSIAKKETHKIYALYDIARCYIHLLKYDEAHAIMTKVHTWAQQNNDSQLLSASLQRLLLCSIKNTNINDAKDEFECYKQIENLQVTDYFSSLLLSRYYILTENYPLADYYLNKSWDNSVTIQDSIQLWYNESLIDQQLGKIESSYIKYKKAIDLQNQNLYKLLDQPVLGAQKDYFETLSQTESLIAKQRKSQLIIITLLLIVLIFISILSYLILKNKVEQKKRDYLLFIAELSEKDTINKNKINDLNKQLYQKAILEHNINKNIELLNEKVKTLFHEQFGPTDFVLTRYYEFMSNSEKAKRLYKIFNEQLHEFTSKEKTAKIDSLLNELYNQIMFRLTDSSLNLSAKEVIVFRFLIAGLSVKSIGTLLNCSKDSIYKTRDRALHKMEKTSPSLYSELRNILKIKQL